MDVINYLSKVVKTVIPALVEGQTYMPTTNDRGEMRVIQSLLPETELCRLGSDFTIAIATASAFTYVNAWPTTRGELVVYNSDPALSLVLKSAFMYNITSMAAAQPLTLIAQVVPSATAPTDDTAQLIFSRSGKSTVPSTIKRAVANTAMGQVANKWEVLACLVPGPTTNLGAAVVHNAQGGWIVPPGGGIAFAGIAGTAAGTAIIGATFSQVRLSLG